MAFMREVSSKREDSDDSEEEDAAEEEEEELEDSLSDWEPEEEEEEVDDDEEMDWADSDDVGYNDDFVFALTLVAVFAAMLLALPLVLF